VGFAAHLFYGREGVSNEVTETIQAEIEARLARAEPDVEVLLAERVSAGTVRLVIDRPGGVDLGLCEQVTAHLRDLLAETALEVSSPGPERPLTKPEHFRRFLGRRARIRTRSPRDGRRNFTGELVGASDTEITLAADGGVTSIPYAEVGRGNLVEQAGRSDTLPAKGQAAGRGGG
jgi:ribosome maturation factor RimP